jgi:hypothetical protein
MIIIAALIISLLMSLLFLPYKQSSALSLTVFFIVLFMAAIFSQYWILPIGPIWWGITWIPMFFTVLIFALLFSIHPPKRTLPKTDKSDTNNVAATDAGISTFTWVLFVALFIAIVAGFYKNAF